MSRTSPGDLAYAARTLRKAPGFTLTAMVTIALGIGATTAIFSVVNAVLLRPLPYADADRLVLVQSDMMARHVKDFPLPPGDFPDLRDRGTLFESVGALVTNPAPLGEDGFAPEQVTVAGVTTGIFNLLGFRTVLGRGFVESDGTPAPAPPALPAGVPAPAPPPGVAVLSNGFWRARYGADPGIVGRTIRLGGGSFQVVGVLAPGAELLLPPDLGVTRRPDLWVAMRIDFSNASRINVFLRFLGRLKPGVSVAQAQTQVDGIVADLKARYPIDESVGLRWRVEPMHAYLVADARPGVLAIMGAVIFVLLIACANVANLLLVRSSGRERELVVRAALGARRAHLIRQVMAESLLIAAGGAVLGVALAFAGIAALRPLAPATLPRIDLASIDLAVLGVAVLAALAAAVAFGLVPALRASRADASGALRAASRTGGLAAGKVLRSAVVVAEVALAFVLLVGSGLMIRSFRALQNTDPGFDPAGVLTFVVGPPGGPAFAAPEQRRAFMRDLRSRFAALPGVTAVSAAFPLPLDGREANARWGTEEAAADPAKFQQADVHIVLPGYFEALRTRLLDGRTFTEDDNDPQRAVVIVDRLLAAKAFPGRSAVGRRLFVRVRGDEPEWVQIIGVVEHQRQASLATPGREAMFYTDGYLGHGGATGWVVHGRGDPLALAPAVRRAVASYAPSAPVAELQPMQALVSRAMAPTRFALTLIGIFAVIAALLAAVGLYSVLATAVRQRTAEIGIRMTFGAEATVIFRLIVGQGMRLSGLGIAGGLVAAFLVTRAMRSLLVDVRPTDPLTFGAIAVLFLAVAAAASWVPARRAARLDPAEALREE
jgi:predicted permease